MLAIVLTGEEMATQTRIGKHFYYFGICVTLVPLMLGGCSRFADSFHAKSTFEDADKLFRSGRYQDSLNKYKQIIEEHPARGDAALFEMAIIYSDPKNEQRDLAKSLESYQKLITNYPGSSYRQDSEMMMFYINNVPMKDQMIATRQAQVDSLKQAVADKDNEIATLQNKYKALQQQLVALAIKHRSVDQILIEKKERQLTLLSKGEVLKSYKIALGAEPIGPKERYDDSKTPEGTYIIDSRNKSSHYHLSLHISYPNERDKRRAKKLGVSPGGDIMIHGLKNGFSRVGESHADVDWTKGCIAVTDEEIEEIDKLVSNGTVVVINP